MKTYKVIMNIRAECESDAEELLNNYTGEETDISIREIKLLDYEYWLENNHEAMVEAFLQDNKEFDRMCREAYEDMYGLYWSEG